MRAAPRPSSGSGSQSGIGIPVNGRVPPVAAADAPGESVAARGVELAGAPAADPDEVPGEATPVPPEDPVPVVPDVGEEVDVGGGEVDVGGGEVDVGGGEVVPGPGSKVPTRCHWPVKLLKGPPTIWLVQVRVNEPVDELYVPVGPDVKPGEPPPGLGAPWLKYCLFHPALQASRLPVRSDPSTATLGVGTDWLVWGSVASVVTENFTPKNATGCTI
jgi:hypothetical protein